MVGLTGVIVAVTDEVPRVLAVRQVGDGNGGDALPCGPFDPERQRTLDSGLRRLVAEQAGLDLRYVEQLYTFGDRGRDPYERMGGPRLLSVAYLALTQEQPVRGSGDARWRDWYGYLPWEEWRFGRPPSIDDPIRPALSRWIEEAADAAERRDREERVGICFGLGAAPWDPVRTLERYELLYEVALVGEALRDRDGSTATTATASPLPGTTMALDNRRILATALGRLRGKLAYRPLVFDLLPGEFTLFRLQRVVEALSGQRLHKQNFRRTLAASALVEPTGRVQSEGRGRPAELFRFRRAVLRAKPTAGVAMPTLRPAP
ncbi:MAG: hypothetical protein IPK78_09185 [Rhodospirillales bacterium]|nr:hypothetical protein [Rhodospirillales bacterium]